MSWHTRGCHYFWTFCRAHSWHGIRKICVSLLSFAGLRGHEQSCSVMEEHLCLFFSRAAGLVTDLSRQLLALKGSSLEDSAMVSGVCALHSALCTLPLWSQLTLLELWSYRSRRTLLAGWFLVVVGEAGRLDTEGGASGGTVTMDR